MGESRKRKSLWDIEDETKHLSGISEFNSSTGKDNHSSFDSRLRHEFSASGNASAAKSREHSGWPNWESLEGNTVAPVVHSFYKNRQDNAEAKEIGRGKNYSKNLSPGFGGAEWRKRDHTPEYDWSSSGRYKRGRSRSRSRSRSKSRSRRRARSRSRSRDKARDRGRGRSRSRSRSDGSARGQTRSRTPIRDHRQSGGWSDGRSRHEKLSRTCRDFATGRCKRGSQCRFFHSDNIRSDTNRVEDDREENWRNRPELGHISGHSNDRGPGPQPRNDVNNPFYEENEQFRNQSRNTVPCRDFMKGKCRWGETCRFSHHEASGESHGKGTRNASFGRDIEQHANKNVKPPCKFFAEGNCNRDNCWFSHEGPKLNNLEGRPAEDTNSFSLDDKNKWWNSPSWDDTVKVSDTVNSSGWTETIVANKKIVGEIPIGRTDNGLDHSSENERTWGISKQNENYLEREQQLSVLGGSGSYDVDMDMDITESMDKADKQEHIVHDSQLQNEDGISNVYGQNTMQEDHSLTVKTSQQDFVADSHIQQQQHLRPVEDNVVNLFGSDAFDEVNGSGNAKHPVLFPGHIFSQNGESLVPQHSLLSNGTDREHVLTHLNGPQQHKISPSTLRSQMQNLQSAVKMSEMSELQASQFTSDAVTTEQTAQMTKSPVRITGEQGASLVHSSAFMAQRFVNEQQPQVFTGLDTSSSMGRLPSYSGTAHLVPLVYTMNSNPVTSSLDQLDQIRNGKVDIENNHNLASATVSHSIEQKNQMHVELSLPLSTVDPVIGSSTVKHHASPKATEQEIISNSEVNGGCQTVKESKSGQENKHSENLDGHGIVEQGSAMKDDKGMRLFKNALVEFVKEILKPTWKEGQMSREVHKTIVKKVVDKVTSTIQGDHIPKTQNKVEQYLTVSKPKITKLVQAYLERSVKTES